MVRWTQALFLALAAGAAQADDSPSKTFEAWTATCNNIGACVALGSSEDDGLFYLRISRDAGATAAPAVKIVLALQEKAKGDVGTFRLTAKEAGKATVLGPFKAKLDDSETPTFTAEVAAGEPSLAIIEALRNAASLDYAVGASKGTLDLKGLSAALRSIDARQGRAGTPTALVARGMTPVGQVPPPRELPIIDAAPADSVSAIAKPTASPAVLAAAATDCDPDVLKQPDAVEAWTVGSGRVLVSLSCTAGAYNFANALYLTDEKGAAPKPVDLPRPPGETNEGGANVVVNAAFDPKTLTLTELNKGRGISDCGSTATWLWTGTGFALLEATNLDACPGALADDWPSVYVAKRK